jgi:integrase
MLSGFVPADQVASYQSSPDKKRIDLIGAHLIEQRYLRAVIAQHVREWLRFTAYLQTHGATLPPNSRAPAVEGYLEQRLQSCQSASRARFVRASVRIFLEADETGRFRRRVGKAPLPMPAWLATIVDQYVRFLKLHRGSAARTVAKHLWQLRQFAEAAARTGVTNLAAIRPRHIQQFLIDLRTQASVTRMAYATTLRSFLAWAYAAGVIAVDLRPAVTAPRRFKQRGIRDVLTDSDVARILAATDRASVTGRRDYAVLILAARYGLRPCDIRQLQLDNVHWREAIVAIHQAKTGRLLTLPLLPEVSDALIAYLRDGRPATDSRHVFVRHRAPFEPFVAANNLAAIMRRALQRVGLDQRRGRRGLYLFRHTLANRMLAAGCPIKSIGDVLGHASTDATMEYASIDLAALRRVALSEQEVRA